MAITRTATVAAPRTRARMLVGFDMPRPVPFVRMGESSSFWLGAPQGLAEALGDELADPVARALPDLRPVHEGGDLEVQLPEAPGGLPGKWDIGTGERHREG